MIHFLSKNIINPIRDFIYPPICFTCNQYIIENRSRICPKCWDSFTRIQRDSQAWLELKSKFDIENVVQDVLSSFLFEKEGKLQEVIHLLKYQGMKSLGVRLGIELGKKIASSNSFSHADYLIPVPLHKLKRWERGYNQSDYICMGIAEITNIPVNTAIVFRKKYTRSQTQLNLLERRQNVDDAFEINAKCKNLIQGKTFIIVDDVITTGSTINACAKQFVNNGANSVLAAAIAVAS